MKNFAIVRWEKAKSCSEMTHRSLHNGRARGFLATDQNEDRSNIKTVIYNGTPLREVMERKLSYADFFKEQLERYGIKSVRRNACYGFELVLTMSDSSDFDNETLKRWVAKNMKWVCDNFGSHNLFSARLHIGKGKDDNGNPRVGVEETSHLHILLSPFYKTDDGTTILSANRIISGPAKCIELQDSYCVAMSEFGLSRGLKKVNKDEHKKAKEFWKEEAKKSRELEAYKKMFGEVEDFRELEQRAEFKMVSKPEIKNEPDEIKIERIVLEK